MLLYLRNVFLSCLLLTINLFAEFDFINPVETTYGTPDLSEIGADNPQIASSDDGSIIYAVWTKDNTIRIAKSSDFGLTWETSTLTKSSTLISYLHLITSSDGVKVYVIWLQAGLAWCAKSLNSGLFWSKAVVSLSEFDNTMCQVAASNDCSIIGIATERLSSTTLVGNISTDFGTTWNHMSLQKPPYVFYNYKIVLPSIPGSTFYGAMETTNAAASTYQICFFKVVYPTTTYLDLISSSFKGSNPQIVTSSNGQYIYVTWSQYNGSSWNTMVSYSINSGTNWTPITFTSSGADVSNPQIATDSSGQNVYITWSEDTGSNHWTTYIAHTDGPGNPWNYSTLTDNGTYNSNPQIATSLDGKYVYVIWQQDGVIQSSLSENFGTTWSSPSSTPGGTPNLNLYDSEGAAINSQMAISDDGLQVYALWQSNNADSIIQVVKGLFPSDFNVYYNKYKTNLLLQKDYVNELHWNRILAAQEYRIYLNSVSASNLIYAGNRLKHFDHGASYPSTYYVVWVDGEGNERSIKEIQIP